MRTKWLAAMAVIGVLLVGCSDDGDNQAGVGNSQSTMDLSAVKDTPFCSAMVEVIRSVEAVATNQNAASASGLSENVRLAIQKAADLAPDGVVKADLESMNENAENSSPADLFDPSPNEAAVADRVNSYGKANCE